MLKLVYFTLCALMMLTSSALAYIDPATTNVAIQAIAAVLALGGAAVGIYWKKIQLFFRGRKQKKLDAQRSAELKAQAAAEAAKDEAEKKA